MNKDKIDEVLRLHKKIEVLSGIIIAYETKSRLLDIAIDNRKFRTDSDISSSLMNTIENLKEKYENELNEL